MKKHLAFIALSVTLLLASCTATKDYIYLQDMLPGEQYPVDMSYETVIMKDDRLDIAVSSSRNPELAIPFNVHGGSINVGADGSVSSSGTLSEEKGYRVDANGNIDFPILGSLHLEGLTVSQATELIKEKIQEGNYMKMPLVSIEFLNFRYTVIGAVSRTGTFSSDGDKVTLFEAIAQAGGLAVNARVDKVAVIRNVGDDAEMYVADLRTKDVFTSPCYYLQQNDVIYVEPRYIKRDAEDRGWQIGTMVLSALTAICSFIWAGNAIGIFPDK